MSKYRKKPIIIDAWQWNGSTLKDAKHFCQANDLPQFNIGGRNGMIGLVIPTLSGDRIAQQGDWIIRDMACGFYPCKDDVFLKTYE